MSVSWVSVEKLRIPAAVRRKSDLLDGIAVREFDEGNDILQIDQHGEVVGNLHVLRAALAEGLVRVKTRTTARVPLRTIHFTSTIEKAITRIHQLSEEPIGAMKAGRALDLICADWMNSPGVGWP
jgi:hypothetical protein